MNSAALETSPTYNFVQSRQVPHRKPLPAQPPSQHPPQQIPQRPQQSVPSRSQRSSDRIQPLTKIRPDEAATPPKQRRLPSHTHTRTTSSATLPPSSFSPPLQQGSQAFSGNTSSMYQQNYSYPQQGTRRTLSNATTSTSSTNGGGRKNSTSASTLQRTTSARSGSSSTSYVALMRKQKATVWSDRAQHEDPRLVAQQRAAKMRAAMEVNSNPHASSRVSTSGNSSITGGMRAKIRHHGAPKAQQYNPTPTAASGVPMRLSAREVDEESEDDHLAAKPFHQRSSSGRSSVGSAGRASSVYGPAQMGLAARGSSGSSGNNTPPQMRSNISTPGEAIHQQRPRTDTQISTGAEPTPVPDDFKGPDYFSPRAGTQGQTPGSTNSERENDFGSVATLPHRVRDVKEGETNEDLQRRGSVDERTMTMRGYGRLFVANPDLDD